MNALIGVEVKPFFVGEVFAVAAAAVVRVALRGQICALTKSFLVVFFKWLHHFIIESVFSGSTSLFETNESNVECECQDDE